MEQPSLHVHELDAVSPLPRPVLHGATDDAASARVLVVAPAPFPAPLCERVRAHAGAVRFDHLGSARFALDRIAADGDIDVVLIDAVVCDLSAGEFCERLAQRMELPPPVIVMLGAGGLRHLPRPDASTVALEVLVKPLREAELALRLAMAARMHRERRTRSVRETDLAYLHRERNRLRGELERLKTRDAVTGLFNAARFIDGLESALIATRAGAAPATLLIVNIDRFSHLRAQFGDRASNRLLAHAAGLLPRHLGPAALIGSLGSDELAAIMHGTDSAAAAGAAESLRLAIAALSDASTDWAPSASIGITELAEQKSATADAVVGRARRAAFVARQLGGNLVHVFRPDDPELLDQRESTLWAARIRNALNNDGFRLVFQPVMRISDKVIDHYEVLVRMLGEGGELLMPLSFIPIAERTGLIHDIDRWVVSAAIGLLHRLDDVRPDIAFNVNLSGRAFQDHLLLPHIYQRLDETGIDPRRITFEITETAAIANIAATQEMVAQLRALGCRFALDDFGAGFASYSYLKQLDVDVLKIDGAFIRNLAADPMDQVLVRSMVDIASQLGKRTVAEFVGDQPTLDLLGEYGVDYAQGYYVGKPSGSILPRTGAAASMGHA